jgi:hypothetical protein
MAVRKRLFRLFSAVLHIRIHYTLVTRDPGKGHTYFSVQFSPMPEKELPLFEGSQVSTPCPYVKLME